MWGWISYNGMGVCWKVDGRFNADNYLQILENVVMPSVGHLFPNNSLICQQDNFPLHTTVMSSETSFKITMLRHYHCK
jgi:hypothetical protein